MGDRRVSPPNYTQLPNQLLDEVVPEISTVSELKVTLAIARQTFGWHRGEHLITLSDLQKLTGLGRQSCQNGIDAALERGFVGRREGSNGSYVYGFRVQTLDRDLSPKSGPASGPKSGPPPNQGKKEVKKTPPPPEGEQSELAAGGGLEEHFFELWKEGTGKNGNTTFTPHRRKRIRQRFEEAVKANDGNQANAISEVETAIAGMVHSDWHRENGHQDFDQLFRGRDTIEKFRDRRTAQLAKGSSNGSAPAAGAEGYDTTRANPEVEDLKRRARAGDTAAQKECREFGIDYWDTNEGGDDDA